MKNKILAFIGDGEGKTSAAIGHAMRAAGHGKKVAIIQFLKGRDNTGEYSFCRDVACNVQNIEIHLCGDKSFIYETTDRTIHKKKAKEGVALCKAKIESGKLFLLVLDEILDAHAQALISIKDIDELISKSKSAKVNLILTGRILPEEISKHIDLITRMQKIKHYYDTGEKGIEGLDW